MKISLVICTYMRPEPLLKLLNSVFQQSRTPDEIIIVDGSTDHRTEQAIYSISSSQNLKYFLVEDENRGLTKQRNFGVANVDRDTDLISFLDDDLVLEQNYFYEIIDTFKKKPTAVAVGGIDLKDNKFIQVHENELVNSFFYYYLDGWKNKEPVRYLIRKLFGLLSDLPPGIIPDYGHGRSGYPPNGITYKVEHFMGGIATYKKWVFERISFSTYFEGYGLYEDFDFCVRLNKLGDLYVNTSAQVWHYHEPSGRPNKFKYGKMVVRNGWYVWKIRYPQNTLRARVKWHLTEFLLAKIRLLNFVTGPDRFGSLIEYLGRTNGWFSLLFNKPTLIK